MKLLVTSLVLTFTMMNLSCQSQNNAVKQLETEAFAQKLKQTNTYNLVDIRTPDEYKQGHLDKAVMIDYYSSDFKNELNKLDKSKPLFYYCASGGRSGKTIPILQELGFKEVYELKVGFNGWRSANKPFVK
ncbi:rhodanese-like domain-containing protein [Chryseotalea sanaruensis]|uniref:Rhodanese-like domain-containing protein n=1 Tax=Chryseotalea sanaruensis TaxID=2482724 RepID=A0A401U9E8_9BACT|nr:rhodanese-like domain-containing protein [Chryseotalea sanaruensis]GCC51538.1 rhodanese-like domain-containing protein [Chryseotalea sanaruensis]